MNGMKKSNNMSKLEWTIKLIIIVVGSVVAAYGITLALYAGFGGATLDCFLKRHHLGVMMSFGCYFIGHIKAHSIVVNSW